MGSSVSSNFQVPSCKQHGGEPWTTSEPASQFKRDWASAVSKVLVLEPTALGCYASTGGSSGQLTKWDTAGRSRLSYILESSSPHYSLKMEHFWLQMIPLLPQIRLGAVRSKDVADGFIRQIPHLRLGQMKCFSCQLVLLRKVCCKNTLIIGLPT